VTGTDDPDTIRVDLFADGWKEYVFRDVHEGDTLDAPES